MKIVVNRCFGGFRLCNIAEDILATNSFEISRTDANLIKLIEEKGAELVQEKYSKLEIVEIPDDITDWELNDYDGYESIIYVMNGRIYHA